MAENNSAPESQPIAGSVPKPIVLAIMDGWGVAPAWGGNAISLAKTPFMNMAAKTYPNTTLKASGEAVGLPAGERGNSEVGHLTIGSGEVVMESLPSINSAINDGSFFKSEALVEAFTRAKANNKAVHVLGLASDGGIHSHIMHLYALIDMAEKTQLTNFCIHAITDGRDTPPFVAQEYLSQIKTYLAQKGFGKICTVTGRYYAMDRDHRWDRIEKFYRAMTEGVGLTAQSPEGAVATAYRDGFSDEFIQPTVINGEKSTFQPIQDGDSVIFFNFRGDRAREITQAIVKPDFDGFKRKVSFKDVYFVGFGYYQEGLPIKVAFKPRETGKPLAALLSENKLKQLHVAESEKYAHVTYFFNGGNETPYPGEDRIVIPSPKVASYDQVPEMSAKLITKTVIENLDKYDFIILNFANPDMVGHTGNLRATIQACEIVDECLSQIFAVLKRYKGVMLITADHGNAEQKVNPKTGEPDTEHSRNPVPLIMAGDMVQNLMLQQKDATLGNIAATVLQLLNKPKPDWMLPSLITGKRDTPLPVQP